MTQRPSVSQQAWDVIQWAIRVPVTCPACGEEALIELNAVQTLETLDDNRPLYLHAFCHSACWNASEIEREQIREYLLATQTPIETK